MGIPLTLEYSLLMGSYGGMILFKLALLSIVPRHLQV